MVHEHNSDVNWDLNVFLFLHRVTGSKIAYVYYVHPGHEFYLQVQKLTKNEMLMVNIGSLSTGGRVLAVRADLAKIQLTQPVCTEEGEKIALSRRIDKHWR